jgi:hypothetical protein
MMRARRLRSWFGTRLRGWADTVDPGEEPGRGRDDSGFGGLNLAGAPEHWARLVRESALRDGPGPVTVGSPGTVGSSGTGGSSGAMGSGARQVPWWRGRSVPITPARPLVTDPLPDTGRGAVQASSPQAPDPPPNPAPPTGMPAQQQVTPTGQLRSESRTPGTGRRVPRLTVRSPVAVTAPSKAAGGDSKGQSVDPDRPGLPHHGPTAHAARTSRAGATMPTDSRPPTTEPVPAPTPRSGRAQAMERLIIGRLAAGHSRPVSAAVAGAPQSPRTGVDPAAGAVAVSARNASQPHASGAGTAIHAGPQPVSESLPVRVGRVTAPDGAIRLGADAAAAVDAAELWPELPSAVLPAPDPITAPSVAVLARIDRLNREQAAT